MKKGFAAGLLVVVVGLLAIVPESEAWGRGRVFIGVGPVWWGAPNPWWYYPPYYPPPPPQTVIVQPPPVYVEQAPPPPPAPPEPSRTAYWYYCPSAHGYYPDVQTCSDAWVKVPPRAQ